MSLQKLAKATQAPVLSFKYVVPIHTRNLLLEDVFVKGKGARVLLHKTAQGLRSVLPCTASDAKLT